MKGLEQTGSSPAQFWEVRIWDCAAEDLEAVKAVFKPYDLKVEGVTPYLSAHDFKVSGGFPELHADRSLLMDRLYADLLELRFKDVSFSLMRGSDLREGRRYSPRDAARINAVSPFGGR